MKKGLKENQILVVIKEPGKAPYVDPLFENTLEAFQLGVGGYIECVGIGPDLVMILNEEGKLRGLPFNFSYGLDDIVGTVIVCRVAGEEFASLKSYMVPMVLQLLRRD